jgi:hypothetical protein
MPAPPREESMFYTVESHIFGAGTRQFGLWITLATQIIGATAAIDAEK